MPTSSDETATLTEASFEALYQRLERAVFNVVYRYVWNAAEAQEVSQEAFLRLWKARARVDLTTVEALLFRTAVNLASNRRRALRFKQFFSLNRLLDTPTQDADAATSLAQWQTQRKVHQAVDTLTPKLKAVVLLCEFSGLSTAEIASTLKIPAGTVSSRRNLAFSALKKALGPISQEESLPE
jgi:RNA polymerase sigma factor (sigma-70 family)